MQKELNVTFVGPDGRTYRVIDDNEDIDSGIYFGFIKVSNWPIFGTPTTLQEAALKACPAHYRKRPRLRLASSL